MSARPPSADPRLLDTDSQDNLKLASCTAQSECVFPPAAPHIEHAFRLEHCQLAREQLEFRTPELLQPSLRTLRISEVRGVGASTAVHALTRAHRRAKHPCAAFIAVAGPQQHRRTSAALGHQRDHLIPPSSDP